MLIGVGGVLIIGLLPHSWATAGWWSVGALLLGACLPLLLERFHHRNAEAHRSLGFLLTAATGLAIHAFLDGGALAARHVDDGEHSRALELGVLMHRLPTGVMLGMLAGQQMHRAWLAAMIIAIGTIGGYSVGVHALPQLGLQMLSVFQAVVAGTLVHVLYAHSPIRKSNGYHHSNTIGMLMGVVFLAAIDALHH